MTAASRGYEGYEAKLIFETLVRREDAPGKTVASIGVVRTSIQDDKILARRLAHALRSLSVQVSADARRREMRLW